MLEHLKSSGKTIPSSHPAAVTSESPSPDPTKLSVAVAAQKCEPDEDEDIFDLLIVGGGATGAGVALDAASRGLKTACVEREDFSSGELPRGKRGPSVVGVAKTVPSTKC
jgi:glycerol-3-phosphate dehydrogenase